MTAASWAMSRAQARLPQRRAAEQRATRSVHTTTVCQAWQPWAPEPQRKPCLLQRAALLSLAVLATSGALVLTAVDPAYADFCTDGRSDCQKRCNGRVKSYTCSPSGATFCCTCQL